MAVTVTPHFSSGSLLFLSFSLASLAFFLFISFYLNKGKKRHKDEQPEQHPETPVQSSSLSLLKSSSLSSAIRCQDLSRRSPITDPPSLLSDDQNSGGDGIGEKKRRKRARKKRLAGSDGGEDGGLCPEKERLATSVDGEKSVVGCIYPFSSFSSATQRRIKLQYDQLVKSNDAKALTMGQVGQFANCLVETRNELQHKSEIIKRRFTITKALLFRADRSSFDRHRQQIYKLEAEQKRLEEDTVVYNRLQEQLKLSPAYKTLLEAGARMESNASLDEAVESIDSGFADMSFEELLAQEKKDSFWQRNGKLRSCTS